jgi:hypothetical protein
MSMPLHWLAYQRAAVAGGHRSVTAWARYTLHVAAGLVEPEPGQAARGEGPEGPDKAGR